MKHKHSEVAHAFLDGIQCEYQQCNNWFEIYSLRQFDIYEFVRIKPEPKPDVVLYSNVEKCVDDYAFVCSANKSKIKSGNLKFTFDGETGKLKDAEVIK